MPGRHLDGSETPTTETVGGTRHLDGTLTPGQTLEGTTVVHRIANFEYFDPSDWSRIDANYSVTSDPSKVLSGSKSMRADGPAAGTGGLLVSLPGQGLGYYPRAGDTIRVDFRLDTASSPYVRFHLGCQNASFDNNYQFKFSQGNGTLEVSADTGSKTPLGEFSFNFQSGRIYRAHIHWRQDGIFEITIFDRTSTSDGSASNGVELATFVTTTPSRAFTDGGIGFYGLPESVFSVDTLETVTQGTLNTGETIDDFETGDVSRWGRRDTRFMAVSRDAAESSRIRSGSFAGYITQVGTGTSVKTVGERRLSPPTQPDSITLHIQDAADSTGEGARFHNSAGDVECGVALDDPQWAVDANDGIGRVYPPGEVYDVWIRIRIDFDWSAGTFDTTFTRESDGETYTEAGRPLKKDVDIATLELANYHNGTWYPTGNITRNIVAWFDDLSSTGIGDSQWVPGTVPNLFAPRSDIDAGTAPSAIGSFHPNVDIRGPYDGWEYVGYSNAQPSGSTFEAVFSTEFTTDDLPDYAGPGNDLFMAFALRGTASPTWGGQGAGVWVSKPSPSANEYRLYVLQSDGQNSFNEYFRLFYRPESTDQAYIANPIVWKATDADAGDVTFDASAKTLSVAGIDGYD